MKLANALAYYDTATITAVKGFIVQAPRLVFTGLKSPFTAFTEAGFEY